MWLPKAHPHLPPDHDESAVQSIRALQAGKANAEQQQIAWKYLMYVSGASEEFADLSYRPNDPGATAFAEGRRFVGLMIRKLLRPEFTPKPSAPAVPKTIQKRLREKAKARSK